MLQGIIVFLCCLVASDAHASIVTGVLAPPFVIGGINLKPSGGGSNGGSRRSSKDKGLHAIKIHGRKK